MGETNKRCEIKITAVVKIAFTIGEINGFGHTKENISDKNSSNMEGGGGDGRGGIGSHHRGGGGGGGLIKQQRHSTGRFLFYQSFFIPPYPIHQNIFDT